MGMGMRDWSLKFQCYVLDDRNQSSVVRMGWDLDFSLIPNCAFVKMKRWWEHVVLFVRIGFGFVSFRSNINAFGIYATVSSLLVVLCRTDGEGGILKGMQ